MEEKPRSARFWQHPLALWNAAITLAAWRWRTQRLLLLIAGLGLVVAIVLMSALPLFFSVMTTAGLRDILRAQSDSAQIVTDANIQGISSDLVAAASSQAEREMQRRLGQYLAGPPQTTLLTGNWYLNHDNFRMDFYGVPIQSAAAHLQVLQGHLPAENSASASSIDIMLTRTAALYIGDVQVGDTIPLVDVLLTKPANGDIGLPGGPVAYLNRLTARVVGIFQATAGDAYWDGSTLEAAAPIARQVPPPFLALTSQTALIHMLDAISQSQHAPGVFFIDKSVNAIYLSYTLNVSTITGNRLDDLLARLGKLQQEVAQIFLPATVQTNLVSVNLYGTVFHSQDSPSTLEKYRGQLEIIQMPVLILTAEIAGLILFFVSAMIGALVEREQLAIAVMRSRGSSRLQIFVSLLIQVFILCLFVVLIGPLLALGLVYLVVPHFLTATTRDAFDVLSLDRGQVLRSLAIYTLIGVAVAFLALLLTISFVVRANILTRQREAARAKRQPLWQRQRLDLLVALLAVGSYLLILYLQNVQSLLGAQAQVLVSRPIQIVAPLLLLLAGILFFLRFFPLLLRLLAHQARRRRGLVAVLALAQMERAPRQPMRMALLLGLATAFVLFSLVFSASQGQRARDLATYQAVSDFAGYTAALPGTMPADVASILNQASALYEGIQGVTSVTIGSFESRYLFINSGTAQAYARKTILTAVDANTFARTAVWTTQDSSRSLADLMALLVARRSQAMRQGVVPALVASSTWQLMDLVPGATFHLSDGFGNPDATTYVAVAEVDHIPPVDDGTQGAILVDYQSLVAGRARYQEATQPDYVWLRTSDNPAAVRNVRAMLSSSELALSGLVDRRALGGGNSVDALAGSLLSMLDIGVVAALLLALLANVLLPLFSLRARQTSLAVLRALGVLPGQIARILTWEMAVVLATALLSGLLFGLLLAFTSVPPLVFTGVLPGDLAGISTTTLYTLQQVVPVTIVLPPSLWGALALLLALSALSLALLTRLARRPLLGQALLLDDD